MNKEDDKQKVVTNFVHILEDHGEHLRNHLYQQWLKGEHCDLVIKFKNGELSVHSAVLFAVSPTLGELPKRKPIRYLNMPDMELTDLDPLIKMAYTGVLCVDLQYAEGVAMAARRLGMKDICLAIRGYLDKFQDNPTNGPVFVSTQKSTNQLNEKHLTVPNSMKRDQKSIRKRRRVKPKMTKLNLAKSKLDRNKLKVEKGSKLKTVLELAKSSKNENNFKDAESLDVSVEAKDKEYAASSQNDYIKKENFNDYDDYSMNKTISQKMFVTGSDSGTEDYEDSTSGMEMMVDDSDSDYKPSTTDDVVLGRKCKVIGFSEIKPDGNDMTKPKLAFFEGRRSRAKRRRRNEQGKLKCPGCESMFDAELDLQKHIQSEEAHLLFRCSECELSYIRKSNLTRHMRTAHSKEFHLKCRHCDSIANTEKELREHCKVKHDNLNPFECDEPDCSYKTYKYDFLRRHLQIHNINREFVCDKCGKTFSQHAGLASHRRTCYQLQEYLCDFCGQAFNHIQSMKSHRRTIHLGERPFMCSECGSRFTDHRNLKRHKRIHENSFPYSCEICGQKYRHSNSLKGHMKKHGDSYAGLLSHSTRANIEADDLSGGKEVPDESLSFSDLYSQTFTSKAQELSDPPYPNKPNLSFNRDAELSGHEYQNDAELSAHKYPDADMQLNFNKDQELAPHEYPHNPDTRLSYDKDSELPPHLYIPLYRAKTDGDSHADVGQNGEYSVQNNGCNTGISDLTDLCYSV